MHSPLLLDASYMPCFPSLLTTETMIMAFR
uniref:Uncharacterized protein n=1 Tax=Arundo donax TaxID=35708 RepID=A0A0A9CCM1_ARUDO